MQSKRPDDEATDIVRDGEGVSVPFLFRDSSPARDRLPRAGDELRCMDTGHVRTLDGATCAAIASEAGRAGLAVPKYLIARLRYALVKE